VLPNAEEDTAITAAALLGFSYGGAVVTGTLDHIASRVRELVYLASVPR
jgi:hypothetical protein